MPYATYPDSTLINVRDPQQVLIVAPAWVGDMVMAHVLIQVLRRRYPRLAIDLVAPPWTAALGQRMAEVRQSFSLEMAHGRLDLHLRRAFAREIKPIGHDWAIVLPSSWKSALVPYWAEIPHRTGFRGEWRFGLLNDRRQLDKRRLPRTVDRFVALGLTPAAPLPHQLPAPRLQVDAEARQATLQRLGLGVPSRPLLALAPGAEYGPAKRWPVSHYIELARRQIAAGWAVWVFGSPKDAEITQAIAAAVPEAVDLGGQTSLLEAVDLLALAQVTVSNDSGLMHVAGAVGSRVIGLFGSSSPVMTPPLGRHAKILSKGLKCSPCGKRECPLKHHRCLEDLYPDEVAEAVAGAARGISQNLAS
ncbi:MAG: lipopolysaccharide heptosyltransferase II [Pseudomonadota bacterium]|uniref:lipopolysaccharide heptosyltransferase II n=1 Tax=Thermithiobacillus tepidarius TaxID=929 RepID=UPI0003F50F17|nr:lipopolysaccharide heptosyltransferase II [Thermithiobacillus tepidarius]